MATPLSKNLMASVPQPPWFSPLKPIRRGLSPTRLNPKYFTFKRFIVSSRLGPSNAEYSSPSSLNRREKSLEDDPEETDPVKLAFAKAKEYKKALKLNPVSKVDQNLVSESAEKGNKKGESTEKVSRGDGLVPEVRKSENEEVPIAVNLAMEKSKKYKKNKGLVGSSKIQAGSETVSGFKGGNRETLGNGSSEKRVHKKEEQKISRIDFMGLDFSDKKKSRGLPPGLVPVADPLPEGDLPEVEIIVGDASMFGDAAATEPKPIQDDNSDNYKPKVSTWGVFPRPSNISKTYGGGRNIRPGDALETAEEKAAKEARTRQLLAAYKSKVALKIDPKLKSECEKALSDGDSLMDLGKLKEALPFYENVMHKLAFQSELHGLAALQWSICQDSLNRPNEARVMYEKLQSHTNPQVSKKARQFMFGFQAMEMMKVRSSALSPTSTGYQNYFEAFVEDKANYLSDVVEVSEGALNQALPYIVFLLSPILIVLFIAVQNRI